MDFDVVNNENMDIKANSNTLATNQTSILAEIVLQKSILGGEHRYLQSKKCEPYGTSTIQASECDLTFCINANAGKHEILKGNLLLIPLININGDLQGLQAIDESGNKSLQKGITKSGSFKPLFEYLDLDHEYSGEIFIAEGFATASTVTFVTDKPTVMAIDAGNLKLVSKTFHDRFPFAKIIVAADNDHSKTGQNAAIKTAYEVQGCKITWPNFTDKELSCTKPPSDFNDLFNLRGTDAVLKKLYEFEDKHLEFGVKLVRGNLINPEPINWLWNGWLALGKLQILAGEPGTGKTTLAMNMAAIVSNGGAWPDNTRSEQGAVLIWSGEDDPQDTLIPRLMAVGSNMHNIFFISDINDARGKSRSFDPAKDMQELLEAALFLGNVKLIILDPMVNAVQGDSHKNVDVRKSLQPLVDLGIKLKASILGITHFTKGTQGKNPLDRVTGSLAFGALARVVLVATKPCEDQKGEYLLIRVKSNISKDDGGFLYDIEEVSISHDKIEMSTTHVSWQGKVEGKAAELLVYNNSKIESKEIEKAELFLSKVLTNGPLKSNEVKDLANKESISNSTLRRAKERLKIKSVKLEYKGGWAWALSSKLLNFAEDAHEKT